MPNGFNLIFLFILYCVFLYYHLDPLYFISPKT